MHTEKALRMHLVVWRTRLMGPLAIHIPVTHRNVSHYSLIAGSCQLLCISILRILPPRIDGRKTLCVGYWVCIYSHSESRKYDRFYSASSLRIYLDRDVLRTALPHSCLRRVMGVLCMRSGRGGHPWWEYFDNIMRGPGSCGTSLPPYFSHDQRKCVDVRWWIWRNPFCLCIGRQLNRTLHYRSAFICPHSEVSATYDERPRCSKGNFTQSKEVRT